MHLIQGFLPSPGEKINMTSGGQNDEEEEEEEEEKEKGEEKKGVRPDASLTSCWERDKGAIFSMRQCLDRDSRD